MRRGEQSSRIRTARKRRPARGRANDDVWHPGSSAVRPFAGSAFVGGSRSVACKTTWRSPSHVDCVSGDEGCSAVFETGLDSTSRRIPLLGAVGPRKPAVVARRSSRSAARILGVRASRKRRSHRIGNGAAREPSVRQAPRHSVAHRKMNGGSVARPRGRGGRGSRFLQSQCPRSEYR